MSGEEVSANEFAASNQGNPGVDHIGHSDEEIVTDSRKVLMQIRYKVQARIKSIESIIEMTGLKLEEVSSYNPDLKQAMAMATQREDSGFGQGGPFVPVNLSEEHFDREALQEDVVYLLELEKLLHTYPFASPMRRYYVSSNYGRRTDPFRKRQAIHNGIDLVAQRRAEIISPAPGVVSVARKFGAYGNFVEVDHGSGVTTRYGHLDRILVRKGQEVARGELLGLQGNTGRSTGSHLHYEVRFNNKPLDPRHFLKAGSYVF
jgi:murein DD-endopeptidase MepM/ murein hydrolase activator NlpD